MEKIIQFLEQYPQLLSVAEIFGRILLCILGILIYRRLGKTKIKDVGKSISSSSEEVSAFADGLSLDELLEFANVLSLTVEKIQQLKEQRKK